MNLAYKYRMYPTEEQKVLINKTFGCCRQVYNELLADCKKQYEETKHSKVLGYKTVKDRFDYMKEVDAQALNEARLFLDTAYKNFFKGKARFPKFHSKGKTADSYTTYGSGVRVEKGKIRLPKVGLVKVIWHRKFEGVLKHVTVSRTKSGKYFLSVCTEIADKNVEEKNIGKTLGIDMSYKHLAVYSDGTSADYPKYTKKYARKLAHAQRNFSRTKKGSNNHKKALLKLNKVYEKITNSRKDFLDKESARLSKIYGSIVVEDVNMKSLANKGMKNGKTVNDISFGMFRTMLEYKLKREGGILVKADRFFPSSQLCHVCGYRNKETKNLNVRKWTCPECGASHDRDINAAINLQNYIGTQLLPMLQGEGLEDKNLERRIKESYAMPAEGLEVLASKALAMPAKYGEFCETGKNADNSASLKRGKGCKRRVLLSEKVVKSKKIVKKVASDSVIGNETASNSIDKGLQLNLKF